MHLKTFPMVGKPLEHPIIALSCLLHLLTRYGERGYCGNVGVQREEGFKNEDNEV